MNFKKVNFLFIIFSSLCSTWHLSAKTSDKQKAISITHPVKISEFVGRQIIKGNEINISDTISGIEKAAQPYHDTFHSINTKLKKQIIFRYIIPLCQKTKNPTFCLQKTGQKLQSYINNLGEKFSKKLLYPEGHKPIGSAGREYRATRYYLQKKCKGHYQCISDIITTALLSGTNGEYTQLYDKIKTQKNTCRKNILRGIEKSLGKIKIPKQCLQEKNKSHTVCDTLLQYIETIQKRVFALTELVYGPNILKTSVVTSCLECREKTDNSVNKLIDLLNYLEQHAQCSALKPGQIKEVHSNTGMNTVYSIERKQDGNYSITINLKFSADDDYDGPLKKDQIHEHYTNKVKEAIDIANQKLLGPNGEKLEIVINRSEDNTKNTCAKSNNTYTILIGSKDHRSNASKYASDIDISPTTIIHEILHLFGLCDEYKEKRKGYYTNPITGKLVPASKIDKQAATTYKFKPLYDCRIVKDNSIMSDANERWDNVFKHKTTASLLTPEQFNAILYGSQIL